LVDQPPEVWFEDGFPSGGLIAPRQMYAEFLVNRLALRKDFEQQADYLRVHGICEEK
jgi:hypothetical protein